MYRSAVEEQKARPELKIVTEVQGISRTEQIGSMLKEEEKFKERWELPFNLFKSLRLMQKLVSFIINSMLK